MHCLQCPGAGRAKRGQAFSPALLGQSPAFRGRRVAHTGISLARWPSGWRGDNRQTRRCSGGGGGASRQPVPVPAPAPERCSWYLAPSSVPSVSCVSSVPSAPLLDPAVRCLGNVLHRVAVVTAIAQRAARRWQSHGHDSTTRHCSTIHVRWLVCLPVCPACRINSKQQQSKHVRRAKLWFLESAQCPTLNAN